MRLPDFSLCIYEKHTQQRMCIRKAGPFAGIRRVVSVRVWSVAERGSEMQRRHSAVKFHRLGFGDIIEDDSRAVRFRNISP
jgi:hypothetical protein